MLKILRWISNYSLDAPLVAVVWFHAHVMIGMGFVSIGPIHYYIVFFATWLAYSADRLIDIKKSGIVTERHQKHYFSSNILIPVWVVIFFVTVALSIYFLNSKEIQNGLCLFALVVVYFVSIHVLKFKAYIHKEVSAALIFSLGTVVFAIEDYRVLFHETLGAMFLAFAANCWINLLMISFYERFSDDRSNSRGIAHYLIAWWASMLIAILLLVVPCFYVDGLDSVINFGLVYWLPAILTISIPLFIKSNENRRAFSDWPLIASPVLIFIVSQL